MFQLILGQKYGSVPLQRKILSSEMHVLCQNMSAVDMEYVMTHYLQDVNAKPPCYVIKKTPADMTEDACVKMETRLKSIFKVIAKLFK